MGLCIRTAKGPGQISFSGCSQQMLDSNLRLKPENGPGLINADASGATQDVDAIYYGPAYGNLVVKIPNSCTVKVTCNPDGSFSEEWCCNLLAYFLGYHEEEFQGGQNLPPGWPPNNW